MAILQKGDKAPEFALRCQDGSEVKSSDVKGKILLSFHPLAFTPVCTDQMRDLENHYDEFIEMGVTPFGVSVDAHPSKGVWALSMGLEKVKMLCDFNPKGELAEACGIYIDKAGISSRAALLLGDGKVLWSKQYEVHERPCIDEVLKACKEN